MSASLGIRRASCIVLGCTLFAAGSSTFAQKAPPSASGAAPSSVPAPTAPAATALPPDIVRLKSGSFVRGTIMEHDPQTRTILQTQAGTRTFEASEVVFAGLAARDPGPPATAMSGVPPAASGGPPQVPSAEPPKAPALETSSSDKKVHLRADRENVRYYLLALSGTSTARQALTPACVAPCDVPLERGAYRVALGFGNQKPLVVRGSLELKEGATVEGRVLSRHLTRAAGWTLMGVSTVPLVYGIVTALASSGERKGLGPVIALGGVGGMGGGFVLTRGEDIAEASVVDERPARGASATQGPMSGSGASRFGTSVGGQF